MIEGLLGKKLGMTRYFDEKGKSVDVSVLEVGPCYVTQLKTMETDGYSAVQIGYNVVNEKKLKKPLIGHLKKLNLPLLKHLMEVKYKISQAPQIAIGNELKVDIFKEGEFVDVVGKTKGKGFQGVVKRHGFKGGSSSHGSMQHRKPGSIGSTSPQGTIKGTKMAGHMGNKRMTVQNLRIIKIFANKNIILIKGAVPGAENNIIFVQKAVKKSSI
ncbi:MAG: 50S ribosomal protein L3 [Candidatus Omnitrophica bacterium]|nr:50S ribosomal protein L3 [Candidatus Omnitrophota bacterium]